MRNVYVVVTVNSDLSLYQKTNEQTTTTTKITKTILKNQLSCILVNFGIPRNLFSSWYLCFNWKLLMNVRKIVLDLRNDTKC